MNCHIKRQISAVTIASSGKVRLMEEKRGGRADREGKKRAG